MKPNIHPNYYPDAKVTCSCGNTFTTGSTLKSIQVDICSQCHPFFTGEMKFVDTQGRVEKFEAMRQKASKLKKTKKSPKTLDEPTTQEQPQTLKEMLTPVQKKASKKTAKSSPTSKN